MKNLRVLLIVLGVGAFFAFLSPPDFLDRSVLSASISGNGDEVKKDLDLDPFHSIGLSISADVILMQGDQKVEIDAESNIIDNITTKVKNGSWEIKFKERVKNYDKITIYITIPDLRAVSVAGSGDIMTKGAFTGMDNLSLSVAGSGDMKLEGEANSVSVSIAGSGDVVMAGTANKVDVSIAGSGDVNLEDLVAGGCDVSIAGSGNCKVNTSGSLDVSIVGSGDVYYTGEAKVHSSVMGSGNVHKM
jgi:hypothetical protein